MGSPSIESHMTRSLPSAWSEPLVPAHVGRLVPAWGRIAWLWGNLAVGLTFGIPSLTTRTLVVSLGLIFVTLCLGHSVGLHRGVIHRTYRAPALVRGVLLYFFVLSGLGGPLSWARLHAERDYWQNRKDCPRYFAYDHSIGRDFFYNLHLRYIPNDAKRTASKLDPSVFDDRWLAFLERTWLLHNCAFAIVVGLTLGAGAVATCVCARIAGGILGHWFVGYAAHAWGERRFTIADVKESGTNVWALGVLSFGEGFHNNHHAFPGSARMGHAPHEVDLGWLSLRAMQAMGLVREVSDRVPSLS